MNLVLKQILLVLMNHQLPPHTCQPLEVKGEGQKEWENLHVNSGEGKEREIKLHVLFATCMT